MPTFNLLSGGRQVLQGLAPQDDRAYDNPQVHADPSESYSGPVGDKPAGGRDSEAEGRQGLPEREAVEGDAPPRGAAAKRRGVNGAAGMRSPP